MVTSAPICLQLMHLVAQISAIFAFPTPLLGTLSSRIAVRFLEASENDPKTGHCSGFVDALLPSGGSKLLLEAV